MSCDPTQLAADAKCYHCAFNGPELKAIAIRLLCAIRDGETMACDAASLAESAKCIENCIPQGLLDAVMVSLLCQIAANAGGSVGCQDGAPTAAPSGNCAINYNKTTGTLWVWDGTGWI